jgi:hypothetical protein
MTATTTKLNTHVMTLHAHEVVTFFEKYNLPIPEKITNAIERAGKVHERWSALRGDVTRLKATDWLADDYQDRLEKLVIAEAVSKHVTHGYGPMIDALKRSTTTAVRDTADELINSLTEFYLANEDFFMAQPGPHPFNTIRADFVRVHDRIMSTNGTYPHELHGREWEDHVRFVWTPEQVTELSWARPAGSLKIKDNLSIDAYAKMVGAQFQLAKSYTEVNQRITLATAHRKGLPGERRN